MELGLKDKVVFACPPLPVSVKESPQNRRVKARRW